MAKKTKHTKKRKNNFGVKRKRNSSSINDFLKRLKPFDDKPKRIRVINSKNFNYKKTGKIVSSGTYESDVKLDDNTHVKMINTDFQREDIPFVEKIKKDTKMSDDDLKKLLDRLEKSEEKHLKKELSKKKNDVKKFSVSFITQFEVLINSDYSGDHGTMYYTYEKEEFFNLINRNKRYLNFTYGKLEESLVGSILRSRFIAKKDKEGKNIEEIKLFLIKMLVSAGANVKIENKNNEMPVDIARKLNYKKIQTYFT